MPEFNLEELIPNDQMLHAIAAHLPVALSVLGVIAVFVAIFVPSNRGLLRWVAVSAYVLLAATAYIAVETGEDSRSHLSGTMSPSIWEIVDEHEDMAEKVWIFGLVTAGLMCISIFLEDKVRKIVSAFTVIAALATATWVGLTGHHGGTLVYEHGIGIPPNQVVEWRINPPDPATEAAAKAQAEAEEEQPPLIAIFDIDKAEAEKISYLRDIVPIMEEACVECHTPGDLDSEYDMTTAAAIIAGGEKYGAAVIPGKPDESTLIKYSRGILRPQMPEDDFPLTREQVHTLRLWIYAGAKDDSASD